MADYCSLNAKTWAHTKPSQPLPIFNSWKPRDTFDDDSERMEEIGDRMANMLKVRTRSCIHCLRFSVEESFCSIRG